jgi:hypothetical protein
MRRRPDPRTRTVRRSRLLSLTVGVALVASACGGVPEASVDPGPRPSIPLTDPASAQLLPEVTVWDVGAKEWTQLANILPAEQPVLVWFWAPH